MQRLLGEIRRLDEKYHLIKENSHVLVGLSGGKDSIALLLLLNAYTRIKPFSLSSMTVTLNAQQDTSYLLNLTKKLNIPYYTRFCGLDDDFFQKDTKNPCALCSRVRRGILLDEANKIGADTLALGHHLEDAIETYLMALTKEGRFHTLSPISYLDKSALYVIRPLLTIKEDKIIHFIHNSPYQPVKSPCIFDDQTNRKKTRTFYYEIKKTFPQIDERFLTAFLSSNFVSNHISKEKEEENATNL